MDLSDIAHEFIRLMGELRHIVLDRLLTTALEVLQRNEFLEDVQTNTDKVDAAMEVMRNDLAEIAADAELKVPYSCCLLFLGGLVKYMVQLGAQPRFQSWRSNSLV